MHNKDWSFPKSEFLWGNDSTSDCISLAPNVGSPTDCVRVVSAYFYGTLYPLETIVNKSQTILAIGHLVAISDGRLDIHRNGHRRK